MFDPQKSPRTFGGNYAQAGARDIRCKAREVTFSRNVIGKTKVIAKLGRTVVAGSGTSGAREQVSLVLQKPQSGSGLQVGVDEKSSEGAARQWQPVCVLTGGAGHKCNDESRDGFYPFR